MLPEAHANKLPLKASKGIGLVIWKQLGNQVLRARLQHYALINQEERLEAQGCFTISVAKLQMFNHLGRPSTVGDSFLPGIAAKRPESFRSDIYIYICIYIYIYICVCIHMYIYVYVYM